MSHEHDATAHHENAPDHGNQGHGDADINAMAAGATLHCLTGCAIGEVSGLIIGTAAGMSNLATIPLSFGLAFVFGYTLSTLPLLRAGLAVGLALRTVLAADTVSILTMEVVDNLVVTIIPGAMEAGLVNVLFWVSMPVSLVVAYFAAFPVNRYLLQRGKGHALTHEYHGAGEPEGARRFIPEISSVGLAVAISAFFLGGLVVAVAEHLG